MSNYITREQFLEKIQNDYDSLNPESIKSLLNKVKVCLSLLDKKDTDTSQKELVKNVYNKVIEDRSLTFNQYKCLNAYIQSVSKQYTKTF